MISLEQQRICTTHGVRGVPCEPSGKVGIALKTLGELPLNALRHSDENGTTGWYIWGGDLSDAPDFFQALHVEHLFQYVPEIVPYLALPPGWRVLIAPGQIDVWCDETLIAE